MAELQRVEKQGKSSRKVFNKITSHGLASSAAVRTFYEELTYLSKSPKADNPFPNYLRELMHSESTATAPTMAEAWERCSDAVLRELVPAEEIPAKQWDFATEKTILLVQTPDYAGARASLKDLCEAFEESASSKSIDNIGLRAGMANLASIVLAP